MPSKPKVRLVDVRLPEVAVDAAHAVLRSGRLMTGEHVARLEDALARFLRRKFVVCVSSGTTALMLAAAALRGKVRRPINLGTFGFVPSYGGVRCSGADYRYRHGTGYAHILGEVNTEDDSPIRDAAQAFGAALPKSIADCYSFNANKPLTTMAGGAVATDDAELARVVRAVRDQGRVDGLVVMVGGNYRMTEAGAALGVRILERMPDVLATRRANAARYTAILRNVLQPPAPRESWFMYLLPVAKGTPEEAALYLAARGVEARVIRDWSVHNHPAYRTVLDRDKKDDRCRTADRCLLLPIHNHDMTELDDPRIREALIHVVHA